MLTAQDKAAIVADYATSEGDTGSSEVQAALLTHRINTLLSILKLISKITILVQVYCV